MRMIRYAALALLGALLAVLAPQHPQNSRAQDAQQYPALETATSTNMSFNWAGYVADGGSDAKGGRYTAVSGSWTVPAVAAPAGNAPFAADATWVGIGGVQGDDLIQAGTQAVVDADGNAYYEAWLETLPGASASLPIAVSPGDRVSVSLSQQSPGLWQVAVANLSTGGRYGTTVAYGSALSSAEWIEEMPSTMWGSFIPLSDFGTVRFISGSATVDGRTVSIAAAGGEPLIMVNRRGEPLAATSVLDTRQGGFTVERTRARLCGFAFGNFFGSQHLAEDDVLEPVHQLGMRSIDMIPHPDLKHQSVAGISLFAVAARRAGQYRFHSL